MRLTRLVAPTDQLVSLERAKRFLNVDGGHHDARISDLLAEAVAWLDGDRGVLGRCLMPQTWRVTMAGFPCSAIEVPLPPTIVVLSVKYLDDVYAEHTVDAGQYRVIDGGFGAALIKPKTGVVWPVAACEPDAVRVEFVGGFATSVPELDPLRTAVLMLIQRRYDGEGYDIPDAVSELIANFRLAPL